MKEVKRKGKRKIMTGGDYAAREREVRERERKRGKKREEER